jgi:hypothetical protein
MEVGEPAARDIRDREKEHLEGRRERPLGGSRDKESNT